MALAEINSGILPNIRPEMFVLVPVLIIVGKFLKKAEYCKDKYVPVILGIISIFISCIWILIYTPDHLPVAVMEGFIQGILIAGTAVYGNQIFKQLNKDE